MNAIMNNSNRTCMKDMEGTRQMSDRADTIYDVNSSKNQADQSSKVRQRLRNRGSRLALDDAEIHPFVILKPRRRHVTRISRNVRVRKLFDPSLFIRDGTAVCNARLADAEMLVVPLGERVVEVTVSAGEGGAGARIVVDTDDVDVVGAREPAVEVGHRVHVRGPEHEDFGVARDRGVHSLPGRDEVRLRCRCWVRAAHCGKKG